jgi:hypothetical protein
LNLAALIGSDIVALLDPALTECRKSFRGITIETGITPGAAAVVDADRSIRLQLAGEVLGWREFDLSHRDADLGMECSLNIDAGAGGELFPAGVVALEF